ncbi:uncharacterized protein EI97DRAFT_35658 [Westerdykella ornata]|uniref:F-box domain-containing protein n=1 Tax=Westerdykella ornata TaxID=318751 RepID=A0A6A6JKV9_WESOR|nr:uncharacterized protein EI97DRAFT_35658 [Westerdykella ornata]KAF2276326.1 hypothetical protein EI97DRAFT_35658 [Westerdykella ornata]
MSETGDDLAKGEATHGKREDCIVGNDGVSEVGPRRAPGLDRLPNELLVQIIKECLTELPPSFKKFTVEPSMDIAKGDSEHPTLKALSQVSRRLRALILPFLFQFVKLHLQSFSRLISCDKKLLLHLDKYHEHLNEHERRIWLALRGQWHDQSRPSVSANHSRLYVPVHDQDKYLTHKDAPPHALMPQLPTDFTDFAVFIKKHNLRRKVDGLILITELEVTGDHCRCTERSAYVGCSIRQFWLNIFEVLDPLRVVTAAPPITIASLIHSRQHGEQEWAFEMKMQYLELGMTHSSDDMLLRFPGHEAREMYKSNEGWDGYLLGHKGWTRLSFNEGASVPAYHTYEYHLKAAPKHVHQGIQYMPAYGIPASCLRVLQFIAVFPLADDFQLWLVSANKYTDVQNCALRRIEVQLAPGPEQNSEAIARRIGRCQPQTLWLEWEQCYRRHLMWFLEVHPFEDGAELEARDCWDPGMETEITEWMAHLTQRVGVGWNKVGKGIWRRDTSLDNLIL